MFTYIPRDFLNLAPLRTYGVRGGGWIKLSCLVFKALYAQDFEDKVMFLTLPYQGVRMIQSHKCLGFFAYLFFPTLLNNREVMPVKVTLDLFVSFLIV